MGWSGVELGVRESQVPPGYRRLTDVGVREWQVLLGYRWLTDFGVREWQVLLGYRWLTDSSSGVAVPLAFQEPG